MSRGLVIYCYKDIKQNNFLDRLIEKKKRNKRRRTGNGLPTVPVPFSNWNRMKGFHMAVDRHNLWSSLDFCLCGEQPIPISPELKLYAYKSCLSDYINTHTHAPFSLRIYCGIVCLVTQTCCTKTTPARSRSLLFDMSPCRKWRGNAHMLTDKLTYPPTVTVTTWKTVVLSSWLH